MWIQNSKISQRTITKYRKERKAHTHTHTHNRTETIAKTEKIETPKETRQTDRRKVKLLDIKSLPHIFPIPN
jgi:hypothetical protein